jgi:hypothetical protein
MAVHSICCARYKSTIDVDIEYFCLKAVVLFRSCVFFSCTQLPWSLVGSFLGDFYRSGKPIETNVLRIQNGLCSGVFAVKCFK